MGLPPFGLSLKFPIALSLSKGALVPCEQPFDKLRASGVVDSGRPDPHDRQTIPPAPPTTAGRCAAMRAR